MIRKAIAFCRGVFHHHHGGVGGRHCLLVLAVETVSVQNDPIGIQLSSSFESFLGVAGVALGRLELMNIYTIVGQSLDQSTGQDTAEHRDSCAQFATGFGECHHPHHVARSDSRACVGSNDYVH